MKLEQDIALKVTHCHIEQIFINLINKLSHQTEFDLVDALQCSLDWANTP